MYTPHRDYRFEYVWDVMNFIEENQCRTCTFSKLVVEPGSHADEYPMCFDIEASLSAEEAVEALDDRGDDGVVCSKYRNTEVAEREHPDQSRLF